MTYKSEADQWREAFETMKAQYVTVTIMNTDLLEWNMTLAEETLRVRNANQELRIANFRLRETFWIIAYFVLCATLWNIVT